MASHMLIILLLSFIADILKRIGSIPETLWSLYTYLPSPFSTTLRTQRALQREILQIRQEMSSTSSQDEFAKWAKLRREHDKKLAQTEKLASSISVHKASFDAVARVLTWVLTSGWGMVLQIWWRKEAMFWVPVGWLPRPVEWVVSWPKAPMGSVGINIWTFCCALFVGTVVQMMVDVVGTVVGTRRRKVPVAVPAQKPMDKPEGKIQ